MTSSLSGIAAGIKALSPLGCRPYTPSASRWLGAMLAATLFAVDTFQPVIGLVEVTPGTKAKGKLAQTPGRHAGKTAERHQPAVVCLQAWQWQQSCGELWPTFVFQPTINAGSGGSARSEFPGCTLAALPPVPLVWSLPAPVVVSLLSTPVDRTPMLRILWYRRTPPIGPPVA